MNTRRLTRNALLTGIALIIFTIEAQLPALTPIPGIKLGLSNIVTVYAVFALGGKDAAAILAARVLLGALFSGNISTLMYSGAGGALCWLTMLLIRNILTERQIWVASVIGAMAHNLAQIAVAVAVTRTRGLLAYLPILEISGMLAGLFTGLCAQALIRHMNRLRMKR
ncbi:MAG: Gx transporter family protein [Clostridia bacterium]|nr:Gx transporter family protein [Clostridia bacterium]